MKQKHAPAAETTSQGNWDDYINAYYEKPTSFKSWSGYDLKQIYTPEDRAGHDYDKDVADAGTYPFTGESTPICSGADCGPKERSWELGHTQIPMQGSSTCHNKGVRDSTRLLM